MIPYPEPFHTPARPAPNHKLIYMRASLKKSFNQSISGDVDGAEPIQNYEDHSQRNALGKPFFSQLELLCLQVSFLLTVRLRAQTHIPIVSTKTLRKLQL